MPGFAALGGKAKFQWLPEGKLKTAGDPGRSFEASWFRTGILVLAGLTCTEGKKNGQEKRKTRYKKKESREKERPK